MYVLASDDVNQAYQRIRAIRFINSYRRTLVNAMNDQNDSLVVRREQLLSIMAEKSRLNALYNQEKLKLTAELDSRKVLITNLSKREKELLKEIETQKSVQKEIEREIRRIIETEEKAALTKRNAIGLTPEEKFLNDDFKNNFGKLPWPTEKGVITLKYGEQPHPYFKNVVVNSNGIDISTGAKSSVRAVFKGEVTKVIAIVGANYTVIIRHGNYRTVYQNLINVTVSAGQMVDTKQRIGEVYTDDNGSARYHFEVWNEREILNPQLWLAK